MWRGLSDYRFGKMENSSPSKAYMYQGFNRSEIHPQSPLQQAKCPLKSCLPSWYHLRAFSQQLTQSCRLSKLLWRQRADPGALSGRRKCGFLESSSRRAPLLGFAPHSVPHRDHRGSGSEATDYNPAEVGCTMQGDLFIGIQGLASPWASLHSRDTHRICSR